MAEQEESASAEAKACVVPISESHGRTSAEYATIQGRFQRIEISLGQDGVLDKVVTEMFEKKLITREHYTKCKSSPDSTAASAFMLEILRRIELNKSDFYVFVRSLSKIPALVSLHDELRTSINPVAQVQLESLSSTTDEMISISQAHAPASGSVQILQAHTLAARAPVSAVLHAETHEGTDNVAITLDPVSNQPRANGDRTPGLPPSSAYNGSTGLMPQLTPSTAHSGPPLNPEATSIDEDSAPCHGSKGVYMTPASDTQQGTREGTELIVSGRNQRSSVIEVQDEIRDYESRLGKVEVVLRHLKDRVDGKVDSASHQRLSAALSRQRRSCEFHRGKIISYRDSLTQLKVEMKAEIKAEVKAEFDDEITEIVQSSLQEKNNQLEEMGIELETYKKEVETLERSRKESIKMNEALERSHREMSATLQRSQKEMNEKLEELKVQVVQSKEEVSEVKAKTDALKTEIDTVSATQTPTHIPATPPAAAASERPCQCNCACNIL